MRTTYWTWTSASDLTQWSIRYGLFPCSSSLRGVLLRIIWLLRKCCKCLSIQLPLGCTGAFQFLAFEELPGAARSPHEQSFLGPRGKPTPVRTSYLTLLPRPTSICCTEAGKARPALERFLKDSPGVHVPGYVVL